MMLCVVLDVINSFFDRGKLGGDLFRLRVSQLAFNFSKRVLNVEDVISNIGHFGPPWGGIVPPMRNGCGKSDYTTPGGLFSFWR